jgi:hypothetical protein
VEFDFYNELKIAAKDTDYLEQEQSSSTWATVTNLFSKSDAPPRVSMH